MRFSAGLRDEDGEQHAEERHQQADDREPASEHFEIPFIK
jgi:hypothetical protein